MKNHYLGDKKILDQDLDVSKVDQPHLDLILLEIYTLITAICTQIPVLNQPAIIMILGFPFLTFVPGYAVMAVLFPDRKVGGLKRAVLSVTISLLFSLLFVAGLNWYPSGNGELVILIFLMFLSLVLCFLAYHRRLKLPENQRFQVQFNLPRPRDKSQVISLILLILLALGIIFTVYLALTPPPQEKFTEFYILGLDDKANYNTNLSVGQDSDLKIGIVNHEQKQTSYLLLVRLEGNILLKQNLTLNQDERREIAVTFTPTNNGTQKLEFLLFKLPSNQTEPYRDLYLWYHVGT
ncbi:MAG: DUF1616 domain-containing protein [Methanobacteriaceae archaeon]